VETVFLLAGAERRERPGRDQRKAIDEKQREWEDMYLTQLPKFSCTKGPEIVVQARQLTNRTAKTAAGFGLTDIESGF
jgi:hypothetical protein